MEKEYEIQIEIENSCYLDCLHCSSLLMRREKQSPMSQEELNALLKVFRAPLHIYFTGGEPLANSNLIEILRNTKCLSKKISTGIFTCGVMRDGESIDRNYADRLKTAGLDDCYVSLYHTSACKHDIITNQRGSYSATIKSIRNLIDKNIDVKVHLVICKLNVSELDSIIADAFRIGVSQVRLLRIVKAGAAKDNWDKIGIPYQEQETVITDIIRKINAYSGIVTVSGFPRDIACRPVYDAVKCQAGTHLLYITNSKEVYPCACTKSNPSFQICSVGELIKLREYLDKQLCRTCNEDCLNPICNN